VLVVWLGIALESSAADPLEVSWSQTPASTWVGRGDPLKRDLTVENRVGMNRAKVNSANGLSFISWPAYVAVRFYQRVISPTKGRHCPMYPSCSAFCLQSMQEEGLLKGILMTADRLHRCGHDMGIYDKIRISESIRFDDSPEENTMQYYRAVFSARTGEQ
jgi:putative component of membrane protein insertase Oxa1/YidC/SpoIIIJ protein YidD